MHPHTDWLSFTLETQIEPVGYDQLYHVGKQKLREVSNEHERYIYDGTGFEPCGSRPPYRLSLARDDNGVRIYAGSHTSTILYELAGRACEGLHEAENARRFISPIVERLTRWDYAIDIPSEAGPADFLNDRSHQNFRSVSFIRSDTGETVYCGSPKSDRFCRVYRYSKPHPRAHLLRVEFVFRRGLARHAALRFCQTENEGRFIAELGNTWGWGHKVWQPGIVTDERVQTPSVTKHDDQTIRWLYAQVAPALRRCMASGAIDMVDWLNWVYNEDTDNSEFHN